MKCGMGEVTISATPFAPSRGRELKCVCRGIGAIAFRVRPLAGAGIEITKEQREEYGNDLVRPLAGAGIEIYF